MKAALHAVGRSAEIHPLLALGAELHEVESIDQARAVARELDRESILLLLSDEFAEAETEASAALVLVLPGLRTSSAQAGATRRSRPTPRSAGDDPGARVTVGRCGPHRQIEKDGTQGWLKLLER